MLLGLYLYDILKKTEPLETETDMTGPEAGDVRGVDFFKEAVEIFECDGMVPYTP